jgi:hypothetical protein
MPRNLMLPSAARLHSQDRHHKTAMISVDNSVDTAKYNACMQGGSFVGRLLQSSRPRQELTTGKQTQSAAGISSERQRAKHGRYNSDE